MARVLARAIQVLSKGELLVGLADYLLRESKFGGMVFTSGSQRPCRSLLISRTSSLVGRLGLRPSWFGG
jgi:hypothetical protein